MAVVCDADLSITNPLSASLVHIKKPFVFVNFTSRNCRLFDMFGFQLVRYSVPHCMAALCVVLDLVCVGLVVPCFESPLTINVVVWRSQLLQ